MPAGDHQDPHERRLNSQESEVQDSDEEELKEFDLVAHGQRSYETQLLDTCCARCRELKLPEIVARHPELRPESICFWFQGTDDVPSALQRILFDTSIAFQEQCAVCRALKSASECVFLFSVPHQSDTSTHGKVDFADRGSWFEFARNRDVIQHYSSKSITHFGSVIMGRGDPVGHHVNDQFGIPTKKPFGPENPARPYNFRVVERSRPDYSFIGTWLQLCCEGHHGCAPTVSSSIRSVRLINVHLREVVLYPDGADVEYIALSYVWGDSPRQSFQIGYLPAQLPQTIEDAMTVTHNLGKIYLWVDYVCIDQDEEVHKMSQINIMDDIYSGAWATIISLNGSSAAEGLPRVGGSASVIPQTCLDFGNGNKLVSSMPDLSRQLLYARWEKRGWTFQEGLLSRRKLFFTKHQVYFSCNEMTCQESKFSPLMRTEDSDVPLILSNHLFRDKNELSDTAIWELYRELVGGYTTRKLTYSTDILNALTGVMKKMKISYLPRGFLWGLPRDYLRHALQWEPDFEYAPFGYSWKGSTRVPLFPSWSWTGRESDLPVTWHPQTHENGWCKSGLPPLQFWEPSGEQIKSSDMHCHGEEKSENEFFDAMKSRFKSDCGYLQPVDTVPSSAEYGGIPDALIVQGIIVQLQLVNSLEMDLEDFYRDRFRTEFVEVYRLTLSNHGDEEKAFGSLSRWHTDQQVGRVFPLGQVKRVDCLLVSLDHSVTRWEHVDDSDNGSLPSPDLQMRFHFLMLQWDNGHARRVGTCTLTTRSIDVLKVMNARHQRFSLR